MEEEIWEEIEGTSGQYFISNFGRCKTVDGFIRKPNQLNSGYIAYNLYIKSENQDRKHYRIILPHIEVANIFLPKPENAKYVIHKDGDKSNNSASNLVWTSKRWRTDSSKVCRCGKEIPVICKSYKDGEIESISTYSSKAACARAIGCGYTTLINAMNRGRLIQHKYEVVEAIIW